MIDKVVFVPEAVRDLAEAYAWYQERRPGLGEDFLRRVDACIESIRRSPELYAIAHGTYRRALVRRFPFAVFYEHEGDTLTIYSVFHCAQDPQKWRGRLP